MDAWHEIGFDGVLRPDHVPTLHGEAMDSPSYALLGRLHAIGYMQGLREASVHHVAHSAAAAAGTAS
jgi:mannonate dehydratase